MKLAIILSSSRAEINWNVLRLANLALSKNDTVSVFLVGEGVEYTKNTSDQFDIKKQVESMEAINHVVMYGPADINSEYGGIFYYGVHSVQTLMFIFGDDIVKARITKNGKNASASLAYRNGMLATIIFKSLHYGWETFIETKEGIIELKSRVEETDPSKYHKDIVEMFRAWHYSKLLKDRR